MNGVKDKSWLRGGLFAKYVISLVGLVVFVLAVNGAMETWIGYRATRTSLTTGMADKAEATARRIEQAMSDLERQTSWVTRASANQFTTEQRRADYTQLLNQVPAVSQLSFISAQGREELRLSRSGVSYGSTVDFSRDARFTDTLARGATSYSHGLFPRRPAVHLADHGPYRLQRHRRRRHRGRDRPALPLRLSRRRPGRPQRRRLCRRSARTWCWRHPARDPRSTRIFPRWRRSQPASPARARPTASTGTAMKC